MVNCIVIDDEPFARNLLEEYISKVPYLNLQGSFSSGLKALELLNAQPIDLLFLDIQMPEINGITFLKSLKNKPNVIFTTAYAEFALEGYELNATDYLLKPFDFPRFLKAVEKVTPAQNQVRETTSTAKSPKYLFVKDGSSMIKITLSDIQYIKGVKDYVQIFSINKKVMSLHTLKELSEMLPEDLFSRSHNSYIVGLQHIDSIHRNQINILDTRIPIGATFKKTFMESLKRIGLPR
ncbi:MAG: response regulator transcription factor [Balneolaceae bacterium]|nr:response regulator transcription factor [Balneolaceae bacterium]MBO6545442.1 response regulator transcription factor [Balneolaceae bacterium]MBO6646838.1 response regulator transcription factor [Balneolaceae bacterium]